MTGAAIAQKRAEKRKKVEEAAYSGVLPGAQHLPSNSTPQPVPSNSTPQPVRSGSLTDNHFQPVTVQVCSKTAQNAGTSTAIRGNSLMSIPPGDEVFREMVVGHAGLLEIGVCAVD